MNNSIFEQQEWRRYARHIQLPQIGVEGQMQLKNASVLVVGAGGLGSPVLLYLAAAGVGNVQIFDGDQIELTNLQRQILFDTTQIGESKALRAKQRLNALNPLICIEAIPEDLSVDNADAAINKADIVLDCTDNFATRYLINDLCMRHKKPWLFASIDRFCGQVALFNSYPESSSRSDPICFRCLFPDMPEHTRDCSAAGVIGSLPGLMGAIQATEAIKYLAGIDLALENHLLIYDAMDYSTRKIALTTNPNCSVCTDGRQPEKLTDFYQRATEPAQSEFECSLDDSEYSNEKYLLVDVRNNEEHRAFNIGGVQIEHRSILDQSFHKDDLNDQKTLICYCQTGKRSLEAAIALTEMGYTAKSLKGGLLNAINKQY